MRALRTFVVAALMATTAWTSTHAAERVDLLLVLAADVSGSMDKSKFELQRSGYAAAFSNPRAIEALRGGPRGRVAAAFIEWSGVLQQKGDAELRHRGIVVNAKKIRRLIREHALNP